MTEMYFSVDIESDGPVPGRNSMLSIGLVALHPETQDEYEVFYERLLPLEGACQDADTMKWWAGFPEQYRAATNQPVSPEKVMGAIDEWVGEMIASHSVGREKPLVPIFVAYPAVFDFMFYAYYAHRFVGRSAFGFVALDMASVAMGFNGGAYDDQTKKKWPQTWVEPQDRVAIHDALEDARQQADIFRRMLKTVRQAPTKSFWCGWTIPPKFENPNGDTRWPYGMTGSRTGVAADGGYSVWIGRVDAPSAERAKDIICSAYGHAAKRLRWSWEPREMTNEEIAKHGGDATRSAR